jgi:hypothetical protein
MCVSARARVCARVLVRVRACVPSFDRLTHTRPHPHTGYTYYNTIMLSKVQQWLSNQPTQEDNHWRHPLLFAGNPSGAVTYCSQLRNGRFRFDSFLRNDVGSFLTRFSEMTWARF